MTMWWLMAVIVLSASVSVTGNALAFNPQPDPPGPTQYESGVSEMQVSLVKPAEFMDFAACTMDVHVIAYGSPGQRLVTRRVTLRSGEADLVELTELVSDEIRRRELRNPLVRVVVEIDKTLNPDAKLCEDQVIGRAEVTRGDACRLCAPIPVRMCKPGECRAIR